MYIPEANKTLNQRRKLEKEMIAKMNITETDLAEFFYCPPNVIHKDLLDMNISLKENNEKEIISISQLRVTRDKKIAQALHNGKEVSDVLEKYGMWRLPIHIREWTEISKVEDMNFDNSVREKIAKGISLIEELGWGLTATQKHLGLSKVETVLIKNTINKNYNETKEKEVSTALLDKGYDPLTINRLTGYSLTKLKWMDKGLSDEYINERLNPTGDETKQNSVKLRQETQGAKEKNIKKILAFEMWANGATQLEISEYFDITRATVINWCNDVKAKYIDVLQDNTLLVRRHNLNKDMRNSEEDIISKVVNAYEKYQEEMKNTSIENSNVPNYEEKHILEILDKWINNKDYTLSALKTAEPKTIKKSIVEAKESFSKKDMVYFNYGPNSGKTKIEDSYNYLHLQKASKHAINNDKNYRNLLIDGNTKEILQYWKDQGNKKLDTAIIEETEKELERD